MEQFRCFFSIFLGSNQNFKIFIKPEYLKCVRQYYSRPADGRPSPKVTIMARATMLQPIWAYFLPKSMQLRFHILELSFQPIWTYFYQKVCCWVFHILEQNFKANLGLFLQKSMQLSFHILKLNFTANLGLFLPKSMLLNFHILELNFTANLGLFFYQKVCSWVFT